MSKKNIIAKEKLTDNKVHVTFDNPDGTRKYEYRGMAARGVLRGRDPNNYTGGRLIEFKPKETK